MTPEGKQIGTVVTLNGSAWAVTAKGDRSLQDGDPVFEGESVMTGKDANMEIRFVDGTLLGQGGEARVDLDEYVYDGESDGLDFQLVTGVLRLVSGQIAETNPEAFNVSTPLASIGIRGTEIIAKIDVDGQIVGVTDMAPGHYVVIATVDGEVRIDAPGLFSGVDRDGFLIQAQPLSPAFIDAVQAAVPLTSMGETPRDPGQPQPDMPDPSSDPAGQGGPSVEPGTDGEPDSPGEPYPGSQEQAAPPPPPPPLPPPVNALPDGPEPPSPPVLSSSITPEDPSDDPVIDDTSDDTSTTGVDWTDEEGSATSYTGSSLDDTLSGLDYSDSLSGGEGDDVISGGSGGDRLEGEAGNDTLTGGTDDDVLLGDAGNDSLSGGAGSDFLAGDAGQDTLTGGTEGDTFFFSNPADGSDNMEDFDATEDVVGLDSSGDFSSLNFDSGVLSASDFKWVDAAEYDGTGAGFDSGATSGIVYASESGSSVGKLYFDPDVTTAGDEELLASITEYSNGAEADNNLDELDIKEVTEPGPA